MVVITGVKDKTAKTTVDTGKTLKVLYCFLKTSKVKVLRDICYDLKA